MMEMKLKQNYKSQNGSVKK